MQPNPRQYKDTSANTDETKSRNAMSILFQNTMDKLKTYQNKNRSRPRGRSWPWRWPWYVIQVHSSQHTGRRACV